MVRGFGTTSSLEEGGEAGAGREFACPECGAGQASAKALLAHMSRRNTCRITALKELFGQLFVPLPDKRFQCFKCHRSFPGRERAMDHLRKSAGCGRKLESFDCAKCHFRFSDRSSLTAHLTRLDGCGKIKRRGEMEQLYGSERRAVPYSHRHLYPSLSCPKCGKRYKIWHTLYQHLNESRSCGAGKRLKCERCPYSTLSPLCLRTHVRSVHNSLSLRPRPRDPEEEAEERSHNSEDDSIVQSEDETLRDADITDQEDTKDTL